MIQKTYRRILILTALASLSLTAMAADTEIIPGAPPDTAATLLLLTGFMLLILEIKIISYGALGLLGTACMAAATYLIWRDDGSFWGLPVGYVIPVILLAFIIGVILVVLSVQAYREKILAGSESYTGELCQASEALNPEGRVYFQGTYWRARSTAPVTAGETVRIIGTDKLTLFVEPAHQAPETSH